jgi:hypothetical protein
MPLTKKGKKILASMEETYGDDEKAKRVFYASANAKKIIGVHKAQDGLVAVADADGHMWTRAVPLADNDTLLDAVTKHRDGYLTCEARVARTGVQRYRGYELGMPNREHVTLYRPPEEVFARDSMRSMANKPITLTHPKSMVDSKSWSKVAKGFSGSEVVRDGEYVRVPLMLTDAAAVDAFENGEARELSVGYTTDIDWTAGETPDGAAYDGVQRLIRGNHHALVPVARGGESLRFGDADQSQGAGLTTCPSCGAELTGSPLSCPNCGFDLKPTPRSDEEISMDAEPYWMGDREFSSESRKKGAEEGWAKPDGSYPIRNTGDLKNAIKAWGRGGATASDKAWIKKRAKALGAESMLPDDWKSSASDAASSGISGEEGVMPIIKNFDGIPISFADEVSAAAMEREFRNIQQKLADAGSDNFGGKKAKPFGSKNGNGNGNGNGDDDDDDTEAKRKKVTAEDALKKEIATRDGEIAVLKKQVADAAMTDAKVEAMAAERIAVLDAAKPFLPKGFVSDGKNIADIRRAAVGSQFTDAEMKDWTDDQIVGAFRTMSKVGAAKGGASALADGMTAGIRANAGYLGGSALSDGEKRVEDAYQEYVERTVNAYKKPFEVVRN